MESDQKTKERKKKGGQRGENERGPEEEREVTTNGKENR